MRRDRLPAIEAYGFVSHRAPPGPQERRERLYHRSAINGSASTSIFAPLATRLAIAADSSTTVKS
jgi:hypothetical protein